MVIFGTFCTAAASSQKNGTFFAYFFPLPSLSQSSSLAAAAAIFQFAHLFNY
jgi:hypothetical protein